MQGRHKFAADMAQRVEAHHQQQCRDSECQPTGAQHQMDQWLVEGNQAAIERIGLLRDYLAANKPQHQHRHQRHREQGRRGHGEGLGERQRREHAPLLGLQGEDWQKGEGDDEQGEEEGWPHLAAGRQHDLPARSTGRRPLQMLVGVLHHDDARIHHGADGDGDASQTHDVGVDPQPPHADKGRQHSHRQHQDRHQSAAQMEQKQGTDQRHYAALLQQGALEGGNGPLDERRSIIGGDYLHPLRQGALQGNQLLLDPIDHLQGILASARHHYAGDHLTLAVQLGETTPLIGGDLHPRHILDTHRHAVDLADHQLPQILGRTQIPLAAHHKLRLGQLYDPPAHILVVIADHLHHLQRREVVGLQLARLQHHLVLLDEAPHTGHFGHTGSRRQRIAQGPVLQCPQGLQGLPLGHTVGHQRILVDPAYPGGIRPQAWGYTGGQFAAYATQILQHPRAGPVEIRPLLEDEVDKGDTEEGEAPHHFGLGHREQRRGERIGHLILHHLGGLTRILGVDDHLHIREIGNGIQGRAPQGIDSPGQRQQGQRHNEKGVIQGPADQ